MIKSKNKKYYGKYISNAISDDADGSPDASEQSASQKERTLVG